MEKSLDGCYTRMLRMVLIVSWRQHLTNKERYGELRLRIAGHCVHHPEVEASKVVLWQPARGTTNRGRRHVTFIDSLRKDTGLESAVQKTKLQRWTRQHGGNLSTRLGRIPGLDR